MEGSMEKLEKWGVRIAVTLLFILGLGLAGKGDLQEAQDQASFYDEMVCKGAWPDYENRRPSCDTVQFVAE
jgi:hypothetical protein